MKTIFGHISERGKMKINRDNMYEYYKERYENYSIREYRSDMTPDEWNEYVGECDELKFQAIDCLLNGMSLSILKEVLEKEFCPVITQETQELLDIQQVCTKCNTTNPLYAKYCCGCGVKFTGQMIPV